MASWRKFVARAAVAVALSAPMGACSWFGDDEPEAPVAVTPVIRAPVQVLAVRAVEIGRTRDGLVITAYGTAPGLGYGSPTLQTRREGQPASDGFVDYDFVALPPDPGFELPQGSVEARELRADALVKIEDLQGAAGIRVHGRERSVQMGF